MNYLAHAYLSFNNPDLLIGNLIADCVKGKQINDFSQGVQQGIHLHRKIDEYTDAHPVIREIQKLYTLSAGRYNGVFLDVTFDHFLATDSLNEPPEGWQKFSKWCYLQIDKNIDETPHIFQRLFSYMKKEDWLYNYRYKWMMQRSFERLAQRAKYLPEDANIYSAFEQNYNELQEGYKIFFPELKQFVEKEL
ncbi:acyl carrier protein phosphodiesterase [Dysgonomonas alginatilytica]|uniref:Acyl carrier protein phosphodiesterase n=1 Tax=Dysgonomonas alginatilytica TaxID=1605892 RepID=A0A2V3PWQ0_9BACT|nr:ACP phosphodiesterase [Dysgonomonas alginatilytica]PXV69214.1 acyl carrier protein phosphodiesterase [Dysgonomonas alginatilytica]